jgi:hypothetical protein
MMPPRSLEWIECYLGYGIVTDIGPHFAVTW